jgi:hypothetical protein
MTFHKLRARVHQAELELFQASAELDQAKAHHRQELVNGNEPDRASLAKANAALLEARDALDLALMELQAEHQAIIQKAAKAHIRDLTRHITQILDKYPLEETA